ncbi:MAG: hypothetical protein RIQ99_27 [Pseudomonadota bacterium]
MLSISCLQHKLCSWHRKRFGLAAIRKAIEVSIAEGLINPGPTQELAHLISAGFNEATMLIAYADDPVEVRGQAGQALDAMLAGLLTKRN